MTVLIGELLGDPAAPSPVAEYSRRLGMGVSALETLIRDRGKLIMQSQLSPREHTRLSRLQDEDRACLRSVRRHLDQGQLFNALEELQRNNIRC